jgi:hypothetical protein
MFNLPENSPESNPKCTVSLNGEWGMHRKLLESLNFHENSLRLAQTKLETFFFAEKKEKNPPCLNQFTSDVHRPLSASRVFRSKHSTGRYSQAASL